MTVRPADEARPDRHARVLVLGAGACGLCAALAASGQGADVIVVERDAVPGGSTAMTWGMIPGAGTRWQRARGIDDSPELYLADILAKAKGKTDLAVARTVAAASGPTVEWLADAGGVAFELLDDILYPGHGRHRYHVPPSRTGRELQDRLLAAAQAAGVTILTGMTATDLFADAQGRVVAVSCTGSDGARIDIGCDALVLATAGFGADPDRVAANIPEMAAAVYCGHDGSRGDALAWGAALGAATADLGGYQGHSVVAGSSLPLTWALIINGGFQVNRHGLRFANEMSGYSEHAAAVLRQPGGMAWTIFDSRCAAPVQDFADYRRVVEAGAVIAADTVDQLAARTGLPAAALAGTLADIAAAAAGTGADATGRDFTGQAILAPPFFAVPVRGALFHTQGGLAVDPDARVLRPDGSALPNLFAGGGAARGLSGPSSWGYLGGNGLVTAVVLGRIAGANAARLAEHSVQPQG